MSQDEILCFVRTSLAAISMSCDEKLRNQKWLYFQDVEPWYSENKLMFRSGVLSSFGGKTVTITVWIVDFTLFMTALENQGLQSWQLMFE